MCGDDGHFPQTLKDRGGDDDEASRTSKKEAMPWGETVLFWKVVKVFNWDLTEAFNTRLIIQLKTYILGVQDGVFLNHHVSRCLAEELVKTRATFKGPCLKVAYLSE